MATGWRGMFALTLRWMARPRYVPRADRPGDERMLRAGTAGEWMLRRGDAADVPLRRTATENEQVERL